MMLARVISNVVCTVKAGYTEHDALVDGVIKSRVSKGGPWT